MKKDLKTAIALAVLGYAGLADRHAPRIGAVRGCGKG
jgi:hypothetical protein